MVTVILNEQHALLEGQIRVLREKFGEFSVFSVPASGWTLDEMKQIAKTLQSTRDRIVFASPVPALMSLLAGKKRFLVLHNDKREKKELPGGKIIMTVAKEGWQIV